MASSDWDLQNHDELRRAGSKDPATMNRKQAGGRPRARGKESEEERAAAKAQLMLDDLGLDRASVITAADSARNSLPVNVVALDHGRAFRQPGTAAYAAAQPVKGLLSAWSAAFKELQQDGADDHKDTISDGQEHRIEMMQRLQQGRSLAGIRGGSQGGRARGGGRGGGVIGTRGRGDRLTPSSYQQHASQEPGGHANRDNTASQSLTTVPAVQKRRAAASSPRHRAGPKATASPRRRGNKRDEISSFAGPSKSDVSVGRVLPIPTEISSNSTPRQRWSGAVAERPSVKQQTQDVRHTARVPPARPTRSPLTLANPSDFMSAMAHLRTSDAGNTAPGSSALHIEDASTVTVEEKAKSTVTESSGSISVKTTGNDHGIRAPPEIIFSPEIDAAPYGVRVLTPPPALQRSISPGTYAEDLIGLEIEVPRSVKTDEGAAENERIEAHLSYSDQAQSPTQHGMDLSNAQTLLNTLRGLSGFSSNPSVMEAISDLETAIGKLHETHGATLAQRGAEIIDPVQGSSVDGLVKNSDHANSRSSGNTQGSNHPVLSPRKSSPESAASQPSITSSQATSKFSLSGNVSSRLQHMQEEWMNDVTTGLREVLSITMRDLEQSSHHIPTDQYQPRVSTRVRLPTTNLGEYLLPVGSHSERTTPLSTRGNTSTNNEAPTNPKIRGQVFSSRLQEPRSSDSLDKDFSKKATRGILKVDKAPQETQETVSGSHGPHASLPRDESNTRSSAKNTAVPEPINPFHRQSSTATNLPFQRVESTTFHPRAPIATSMTSFPEVTRSNTVDAVRRTNLPNIAPVNPFSQSTPVFPKPSAPQIIFSLGLSTTGSRPVTDTSSNPRVTISPRTRRLPSHPNATRAAENTSNLATIRAPLTLCTSPNMVSPLSTVSALGGGVSASRWSTATSSMPSTSVAASRNAPQLTVSTALSGDVGTSRWSTAANALSSPISAIRATTPSTAATALGGDVGASQWSTTTATIPSVRELRSTTNLPPSGIQSQTLQDTGAGTSGNTSSTDLGINDTSSLFCNYQRPLVGLTPNVPAFILQARALQNDPGAAARAQYAVPSTVRSDLRENQPLSPSVVSVSEPSSSKITTRRSKDPWDSSRRRRQ